MAWIEISWAAGTGGFVFQGRAPGAPPAGAEALVQGAFHILRAELAARGLAGGGSLAPAVLAIRWGAGTLLAYSRGLGLEGARAALRAALAGPPGRADFRLRLAPTPELRPTAEAPPAGG